MSGLLEWELSNTCTCESYDEETDTATPADFCYGDCWETEVDSLMECVIQPWAKAQGWEMDTAIRIQGSKMTWLSRSGYKDTTPENIIESLSINSEFTLRFKFDGKDLSVVRSSHDELGALFEFELAPADEDSDY